MALSQTTDLQSDCDLLRSLHRPGTPLLLPNAWDVATARAVVAAGVAVYVQPTVTFVYPPTGSTSEDRPVHEVLPILRSALVAERETERFARAGGRGVVLRFGLLDGPGTWFDEPMGDFGATLHVSDAGRALLSALSLPSGIYNVCRDGERVSTERFTRAAGWCPQA